MPDGPVERAGPGHYDPNMEARVARLEDDMREVKAMLAGQHPDGIRCPPEIAIAHHIIRAWAMAAA